VTGASGVLGKHVVHIATERGLSVRRLSRTPRPGSAWVVGDVATGEGLAGALAGVDAVIHCASDPRSHAETDVTGTANLVRAANGCRVVFPGIVGADVIPYRYYRSKTAAENVLETSDTPHTIQRYTQFHDLLWTMLSSLIRLPDVPVPNDTRFQVLDAAVAARHLVDAAVAPAAGRLPDVGGPTVYDVEDLARSVAAAHGRKRKVFGVNVPGLVGAAFRAGGNLTPNRDESGITWNEFVAARMN